MGKISKIEQARIEGMSWAYRYARDYGFEKLEEEVKRRQIANIPLGYSKAELEDFTYRCKMDISQHMGILAAMTLMDKFDFTNEQLKIFLDRMNLKASCLTDDLTTWDDQIQILAEEVGLIFERGEDGRLYYRLDG